MLINGIWLTLTEVTPKPRIMVARRKTGFEGTAASTAREGFGFVAELQELVREHGTVKEAFTVLVASMRAVKSERCASPDPERLFEYRDVPDVAAQLAAVALLTKLIGMQPAGAGTQVAVNVGQGAIDVTATQALEEAQGVGITREDLEAAFRSVLEGSQGAPKGLTQGPESIEV